jgi:hypothetical protein
MANNITSALELHHRVCEIKLLQISSRVFETISAAMEAPFPALTRLILHSANENPPALPDSLLNGSAPHLRSIELCRISFPALPKLLLSTHDLVCLFLQDIPPCGYFSPEAIVTSLSALNRLEILRLEFRYPRSRADQGTRHPPPLTRIVLPALTWLGIQCDNKYLEDIVSRVNSPSLTTLETTITLFNEHVFDTHSLRDFITRTEIIKTLRRAHISFNAITFYQEPEESIHYWNPANLRISCHRIDWRCVSLAELCSSSLPPLPTLERLMLDIHRDTQYWYQDMGPTQWLEFLRPFTVVKDLVVSKESVEVVTLALHDLAYENVTGVLPMLQNLFLEALQLSMPTQEAVGQFIAARQLSGHPVNVYYLGGAGGYRCWKVNDR